MFGLIPNKFTILLGSGLIGSNIHKKILDRVLSLGDKTQVLVICGKNRSVSDMLKTNFYAFNNVHVLGYSKKMPLILKISHLVITRSSSNLSSEAIYLNCLIFILNFRGTMPQEILIQNYFLENDFNIILKSGLNSLTSVVKLFLYNPTIYRRLKLLLKLKKRKLLQQSLSLKDIIYRLEI
jgi:processive 1,2-diacylglycerol beta-glucosyltransferase